MARTIAVSNHKGGVGKTVTTKNIGIALARQGQKVLLIEFDPQGNLTVGLGYKELDELPFTISDVIMKIVNNEPFDIMQGILSHEEGIDLMPANHNLSGFEASLINELGRETLLKRYVQAVGDMYDFILIDCQPSTNILTINAFVAADSILIPTQAEEYSKDGIEQMKSLHHRITASGMNETLKFEGIVFTMWDRQTKYANRIKGEIVEMYGSSINIFEPVIPFTVRIREANDKGVSIFAYDEKSKAIEPFELIGKEIISNERRRQESRNQFRRLVPGGGAGARGKKQDRKAVDR